MKTDTTFDHWNTTPVPVKSAYKSDAYTPSEWRTRQRVEFKDNADYEQPDLDKFEIY